MADTHGVMSDEELLQSLSEHAGAPVSDQDERLATCLVADSIATILGGRELVPADPFLDDGAAGRVALLALRASSRDLDDVDWTTLHHPGSVVIPVVMALALPDRVEAISRALASGYRVAATMADLLGIEHRRRWHVTATAGAIGAASAACVMLGATAREHATALALAATNVGGIGQAALERDGAASFNRSAAATLGLLSARAAVAGAISTREPLSGARGLLALASADDVASRNIREGIRDAAPRIFPVTGFAQSAVMAAANLSARASGKLQSLDVLVTPIAEQMCDGSAGGDWWNLRLAVARAWARGDGFAVGDRTAGTDVRVLVTSGPLSSGSAEVVATTESGTFTSGVIDAPRLDPDRLQLLRAKWASVLSQDPDEVLSMAEEFVTLGTVDIGRLVR